MQVNLVVALIKSNQFEQARKEWERLAGVNDHYALKGIGAFFALRDKKFDEALKQIQSQNKGKDNYSIFLHAQILIAKSKPHLQILTFHSIEDSKGAFEYLAQNLTDQLATNDDYLIFLVK